MEHNEDLARLEQFVEKLIGSHNQLTDENSEIHAQLQAKEQEITELQEVIKNLQEDRNVMHNRVSGLIDKIDDWEKDLDQDGSGQDSEAGKGKRQGLSKKKSSSPLFNVKTGHSSESSLR
jgi:chromosome segregation ATPase